MWRALGMTVLAAAAVAGPAVAQVTPKLDALGSSPGWIDTKPRVYGLDPSPTGANRGLQVGFDRRFGAWSMGLKGDWSSGQGCSRVEPFSPNSICPALNWQGTAAGRIGYAWNRLVAFTQGGAVFSQWDRVALSDSGPSFDGARPISRGWLFGGGLEYALGSSWSLRAEYNYFDYGRPDPGAAPVTNLGEPSDTRNHMLMFGLKRRL